MSLKQRFIPEIVALINERNTLIAEKSKPDDRYTDDANREHAESWTRQYTDRYAAKLAEMDADAEALAARAKAAAAKHQAYDLTDTAVLMRSEQAWVHVVKPALEKGATISEALANADTDAVAAAQRFSASWLQQNGHDASGVGIAVASRLADLAPTPEIADEIRAGANADADLAAVRNIAALVEHGDNMGAGRAAHHALGEGTRFHYDGGTLIGVEPPA